MNDIFKSILMDDWENITKYLEFNGDINISDKNGVTPLIHAVSSNHFDTVLKLIEYGADVNLQDTNGFSALHFAAQNNFIKIAKILLDSDSKVDLQNIYGNTPLFIAVFSSNGNADMINLLISYGADNNLKNNNGVSPFSLSKSIVSDAPFKSKHVLLKILFYLFVEIAILFSLYLYASDYKEVPWYDNDGLKYLHFLLTLPIPLIIAFVINLSIDRTNMRKLRYIINCFPLLCFLLITVYMMADGGYLGETKLNIGKVFSVLLFLTSIVLIILDIKNNKTISKSISLGEN